MQSTLFRFVTAFVTILLLAGLVLVARLVLTSQPAIPTRQSTLTPTRTVTPPPASNQLVTSPALPERLTKTRSNLETATLIPATPSARTPTTPAHTVAAPQQPRLTTMATATARVGVPSTPTPIDTTATILKPTPERPLDRQAGWKTYSNANRVNAVTAYNSTIWAATEGGIVAWNRNNNSFVKFTTGDGLNQNRATSVVNCPLPGLGIVFGTDSGLQIFDIRRGVWKSLNSANSAMSFDDVSALHCSTEHQRLTVGYRQHGLDTFDVEAGIWTHINQQQGLLDNAVTALTLIGDREAIWVASAQGVSALTPHTPLVYDKRNSPLEGQQVHAIAVDATGGVWLGAGTKVYRIVGENWTIYSPTYVLASRFPTGEIIGLAVFEKEVWIASAQGEVCRFDPIDVICRDFFTPADSKLTGGLNHLWVDEQGVLYLAATVDGVRVYDGNTWRSYHVPEELLAGNQIRALVQDQAGLIWVATEAGVQQFDARLERELRFWPTRNSANDVGLPLAEVTLLYADPKRGVWFGGKGAAYFDGIQWTTYTTAEGLANNVVQAIAVDNQERVWFGTQAGVSIWNGETFFTLDQNSGLPGEQITALLADDGIVWMGTDSGLLRFEKNQIKVMTTATTALPSNQILSLAKSRDGDLLVGTARGLVRLTNGDMRVIGETQGYAIRALGVTAGNAIWAGTAANGLLYFDGEIWGQLPGAGQPPAPQVTTILVDRQGSIWVGAASGGISQYVPE